MTVSAVTMMVAGTVPSATAEIGSLQWKPCPDSPLQCATLDVPLDYRNPSGPTIGIAVSRLASAKPAQRRGVLLMNPGGPGGPGLDMPMAVAEIGLPVNVLDSYDLIGFDPRGVGQSTPVTCDIAPDQLATNVPPYARDAADVANRAVYARALAEQCGKSKSAANLPHITTANTARDMDRIRIALGEQKISYYGISYGSYLGAVYSTLFPQRTDRIVLDSVTGTGGLDPAGVRQLSQGFEDRFPDFAKWAAARHDSYGLGRTAQQVKAKYFELAKRLDSSPLPGVTGPLFRVLTLSYLYDSRSFPVLAQQWQAIDRAEDSRPVAAAAFDLENLLASQLHVVCNDTDWPESVRTYQRNVEQDRVRYPMFGAAGANIWPCAFWPAEPIEPPVRINDRGPSTILLVQNLRDPATPLAGAREMRQALGGRARMVTVDEGGHGVFLTVDNACANNSVTRFLVDGNRPAHDTRCGAEKASADERPERIRALAEFRSRQLPYVG